MRDVETVQMVVLQTYSSLEMENAPLQTSNSASSAAHVKEPVSTMPSREDSKQDCSSQRNILLGVGNPIRGQDAVGLYGADLISEMGDPKWTAIRAEMTPENFTSVIRSINPSELVILDAADMGLKPGEARIIPREKMGVMHFSTHAIPLSVFMDIVEQSAGRTYLLGIQVEKEQTALGMELPDYARDWVKRVVTDLVTSGLQIFQSL